MDVDGQIELSNSSAVFIALTSAFLYQKHPRDPANFSLQLFWEQITCSHSTVMKQVIFSFQSFVEVWIISVMCYILWKVNQLRLVHFDFSYIKIQKTGGGDKWFEKCSNKNSAKPKSKSSAVFFRKWLQKSGIKGSFLLYWRMSNVWSHLPFRSLISILLSFGHSKATSTLVLMSAFSPRICSQHTFLDCVRKRANINKPCLRNATMHACEAWDLPSVGCWVRWEQSCH